MRTFLTPTLIGIGAGTALQLQQAALWPVGAYLFLLLLSLPLWGRARVGAVLAAVLFAFCLTGLRAAAFQSHALDPSLEGRDIAVTGVVAAITMFLAREPLMDLAGRLVDGVGEKRKTRKARKTRQDVTEKAQ